MCSRKCGLYSSSVVRVTKCGICERSAVHVCTYLKCGMFNLSVGGMGPGAHVVRI